MIGVFYRIDVQMSSVLDFNVLISCDILEKWRTFCNLICSSEAKKFWAVVSEEKKATNSEVPGANLQIFPPNNAGSGGHGYQPIGSTTAFAPEFLAPWQGLAHRLFSEKQSCYVSSANLFTLEYNWINSSINIYRNENLDGGGQPATNNWTGVFSISSYTQYFNVDTDIVLNRLISSLYPTTGDFVNKIDANPDLYGLVWISTTLVFAIASLGNCATYLMHRRSDDSTSWTFDVNYLNVAAGAIYGYALIVPLGYYFVLQYLGSSVSLIRFWCLWGYSLFIFILTSFLLVIPVEFLRWTIILIAGAASASFVGLNLKSYIQSNDLTIVAISAFVLQMGLSIFIKMWFFA
ncbi:UNVERIFIED_CONTAM: protein YIPF1 [Sesamum angustifolium]|uniref:Protein YIP n=1 Tax=Sesamum angustifolium TaxID=2727405 RepID=A0AAW2PUR8_9LAMI